MEDGQRCYTAFARPADIASVFPGEDLGCQVPGLVVRGVNVVPLNVAHLIKFINKLPCLVSLAIPTPSFTYFEEVTEVCFHKERRQR